MPKQKIFLRGIVASPGKVQGEVRIVKSVKDLLKVKKYEIIVASFLSPDFCILLRKNSRIAGIITEKGGSTSHAAILAREFQIPYIAGVETATRKLKDKMVINVDDGGTIYEIS